MQLRLRYSPASPFVRKVLAAAHELGLAAAIERVPADVWAPDSDIARDNPLGKVPVLMSDAGSFIGSTLCCEYLDSLQSGPRLIPARPPARWTVLQRHALADGIMEAAVAHVVERLRRPPSLIYHGFLERQEGKIARALDAIEASPQWLRQEADLATVTLACALGYLDFRLPQLEWRAGRPALAGWERDFARRPSLA